MQGFVFLMAFLAGTIYTITHIYIFLRIKKNKKQYFYHLGFGGMFPWKVFTVCIFPKKKGKEVDSILLIKKGGSYKKLFTLESAPPPNPRLFQSIVAGSYIKKAEIVAELGTGSAHSTALLCGGARASVRALCVLNSKKINHRDFDFVIQPRYTHAGFTIYADCIFRLNLVKILREYLKSKAERKKESKCTQ